MWLQKTVRAIVLLLSFLGLLSGLVLGTETRLLFFWPTVALLGAAASLMVIGGRWPLRTAPSATCLLSVFVMAAYLVGRAVLSPVEIYAREDLFLILGCLVCYLFSATILSDARTRGVILAILILVTLGNLAVGFVHFSGKWNFHIVPSYMRTFGEGQRIGGFFNNSNHLAAFLSMGALFFLGTALMGRINAAGRILLLFLFVSNVIGIALTISRGGLAAIAIGVAITALVVSILVLKAYPHALWRMLLGAAVLIGFGTMVVIGVFSEQLMKRTSALGSESTLSDPRQFIWKAALAQPVESPLTGTGSRMFYEGCIQYRTADTPSHMKDAQFVHNDWLQLFTDYGWIGLGLGLMVLALHFKQGIHFLKWHLSERFSRNALLTSRNLGYVLGSMTALVAVLSHALVDFHLHVPAVALTASLFLGILANPGISEPASAPLVIPGFKPLLKVALLASGIFMIYGSVTFGRSDYFNELATLQSVEEDHGDSRIAALDRALAFDSRNHRLWYARGLTRLENIGGLSVATASPLLAEAVSNFETAQSLNPHNMFIALALADAYDITGRQQQALNAINHGIRLAPQSMGPRLSLAIHHHRHQRWEEAEKAYFWAMDAVAHTHMDAFELYLEMLKDWQP
ncbi:hypothetical protein FEM03_11310 [Phragmitibacter flavus]|uniref:O-antigen ligase-related domain-containing protein n=1 Tax=Phragmitibacter flavus TaxID=2576071 RepID=A0A5R8KF03_9BACT|nr:O-antigen ligase family protein [Phragmitibacter flavus]TLD70886.1 hypothetical protein FEM03_11310 [Phragmitibacter flavus]